MELLEYHLGNDVRAFSTLRGDVRADDAYSSFNITHYCGDSPEHVAACRRELCNELSIDDSHLLLPHQIHSDRIVVIDPSDGKVCAEVDCSGIYPRSQRRIEDDVLNGIAFDSTSGKIYLTGKNWPCLYEISIEGIRPGRRK